MRHCKNLFSQILQWIKNYLVALGPHHLITQVSIQLYGRLKGYGVQFKKGRLIFTKGHRELIIKEKEFALAPFIFNQVFPQRFLEFRAQIVDGKEKFDFSQPGEYEHLSSGEKFFFPGIPEDDSFEGYISHCSLKPGMIAFDVGAHAGMVTCFLANAVGETGHVYAFEPDSQSFKYLEKNVASRNIHHITLLESGLAASSGVRSFNRDGTLGAGFSDYVPYPDQDLEEGVNVLSLEDACRQLGVIPDFIKMDIEGAEVEVIKAALAFIKKHQIHFAIETGHRMPGGGLTVDLIEKLFQSIAYQAKSSYVHQELLTWAWPLIDDSDHRI